MSESESEGDDFSASEDEWLPNKDRSGRSGAKTGSGKVDLSESSEDDDDDEGGSEVGDDEDVQHKLSMSKAGTSR